MVKNTPHFIFDGIVGFGPSNKEEAQRLSRIEEGQARPLEDIVNFFIFSSGAGYQFKRLDNPQNPILQKKQTLWLLSSPSGEQDLSRMAALVLGVSKGPQNEVLYTPQKLCVGEKFAGFMVYRMSCCGNFSGLMVSGGGKNIKTLDHHSTRPEFKELFKDKVQTVSPEQMLKFYDAVRATYRGQQPDVQLAEKKGGWLSRLGLG